MSKNFEAAWENFQKHLAPGADIQNWSVLNNYTGGRCKVTDIEVASITVCSERITKPSRITKTEFAKIYDIWPQYLAGAYHRNEMLKLSQNTTYIISLLQWEEVFSKTQTAQ